MVAIANTEEVRILEAAPNSHTEFLIIPRSNKFFNKSNNAFENYSPLTPCISWGYGNSPSLNIKPYSMLAVAWGPLI